MATRGTEMMKLLKPAPGRLVTIDLRDHRRLHGMLGPSEDRMLLVLAQSTRRCSIDRRDVSEVHSREWVDR